MNKSIRDLDVLISGESIEHNVMYSNFCVRCFIEGIKKRSYFIFDGESICEECLIEKLKNNIKTYEKK